jgi:hypothetical protein
MARRGRPFVTTFGARQGESRNDLHLQWRDFVATVGASSVQVMDDERCSAVRHGKCDAGFADAEGYGLN